LVNTDIYAESSQWVEQNECPACGSAERNFWVRDKNRREGLPIECDFWKCVNCGSLYLSPVPSAEDVQEKYSDEHGAPPIRGFWGHQGDRFVDTWARLWSPGVNRRSEPKESGHGRKLLSIGCGYATQLRKYSGNGWDVFGVDSDAKAIEWNRTNAIGTFIDGTFESAEFDVKFDMIHCSAVIEHIYDPLKFIEKAKDLLSPDGRILFFTPSGGGAATKIMSRYSIACWVPFHLVLFSSKGLQLLAQRAGLDARIATIAEPHLASLSVRQFRLRNRQGFSLTKRWDTRITTLALAPVWAALNQFGLGEELALEARLSPDV
jgi:SAM-dependent methyltransferase